MLRGSIVGMKSMYMLDLKLARLLDEIIHNWLSMCFMWWQRVHNTCIVLFSCVFKKPHKTTRSDLLFLLLPCHFDHGLWWAVQEYEFVKHLLLHLHFSRLSHDKNIVTQLQHAVHTRQLLVHDGSRYSREELAHKLTNDQNYRHVQTHDSVENTTWHVYV